MSTITLDQIKELRFLGRVMEANDLLREYHKTLQQQRIDDIKNTPVYDEARRALYYRNRLRTTVQQGLCFNCRAVRGKNLFYCKRCIEKNRENRRKRLCQKNV